MSMWISLRMTQDSLKFGPSQRMLPKMTPVSVEETYKLKSGRKDVMSCLDLIVDGLL
jgi:hypothetical protein